MTTHQTNPELLNTVLQLLTEQGASGFAEGIRLLVNEAMCQERSQTLQAQPYQRTETRQGHANGFKPKTLDTGVGPIQFRIPQVRGGIDFYPSALEKEPSLPLGSPLSRSLGEGRLTVAETS